MIIAFTVPRILLLAWRWHEVVNHMAGTLYEVMSFIIMKHHNALTTMGMTSKIDVQRITFLKQAFLVGEIAQSKAVSTGLPDMNPQYSSWWPVTMIAAVTRKMECKSPIAKFIFVALLRAK